MQRFKHIALFCIAMLLCSCTVPKSARQLKKATKDWRQSPSILEAYSDSPLGSTCLTLRENKKFETTSSGFFMIWFEAGSWTMEQDTLKLMYLNKEQHITHKEVLYLDRKTSRLISPRKDMVNHMGLRVLFNKL